MISTMGYRGWWPMMKAIGKGRDGKMKGKEVFRNMVTGETFDPGEKGWDGSPPYPTGDLGNIRHVSKAYRENYGKINWHREDQVHARQE